MLLVDLDPQGTASTLTGAEPRAVPDEAFGAARVLTLSDALHAAQPRAGTDPGR